MTDRETFETRQAPENTTDSQMTAPVGYKNPPRETQFKPGKSGNPKGRPRRKETMRYRLSQTYLKKVKIKIDGKCVKMTRLEAALLLQSEKALRGDMRALQFSMKFAEQLGFLEQVLEGRPLRPQDFLSADQDLKKLTDQDLDDLIRLHEKALIDPEALKSK